MIGMQYKITLPDDYDSCIFPNKSGNCALNTALKADILG